MQSKEILLSSERTFQLQMIRSFLQPIFELFSLPGVSLSQINLPFASCGLKSGSKTKLSKHVITKGRKFLCVFSGFFHYFHHPRQFLPPLTQFQMLVNKLMQIYTTSIKLQIQIAEGEICIFSSLCKSDFHYHSVICFLLYHHFPIIWT